MQNCPNFKVFEQVSSALDRVREAQFHLGQVQDHYHSADKFRWSLNSLLRSLREIPDILKMELQNKDGFIECFRPAFDGVRNDSLLSYLAKERNNIVHKKALKPNSKACIGVTEGRGIKLGLQIPMKAHHDSEVGMEMYLATCMEGKDILGVLAPDEETIPCVERSWRLDAYPDVELMDLAVEAWKKMVVLVSDTVEWLGGNKPHFRFERLPDQAVYFMLFDRTKLAEKFSEIVKQ